MPRPHGFEECLYVYSDGAGMTGDGKGLLLRTIGHGTARLARTFLLQAYAYAMIRRRTARTASQPKLAAAASGRRASLLT